MFESDSASCFCLPITLWGGGTLKQGMSAAVGCANVDLIVLGVNPRPLSLLFV